MTGMNQATPLPPDSHAEQDPPPYLSLVVTSRNDNHGQNIQQRMQAFVDGWFHQAAKHGLASELIFVEWNPPADRPRLIDSLNWPENRGPCRLRLIEVPEQTHNLFSCADRLPLYQFIAKNVGIRRAKAPFILTSNIDILFSDELMAYLATRKLEKGVIYRNDRLDVPMELPSIPIGELITWCQSNTIRINGASWTLDMRDGNLFAIATTPLAAWIGFATDASIAFGKSAPLILSSLLLAGRHVWAGNRILASRIVKTAMKGMGDKIGEKRSKAMEYITRSKRAIPAHTNACGDFELMDRDSWFSIQGYPEYEGYSMHIDSLLLLCAIASGRVREEILKYPMAHYHIEHSQGSGFTPEGERQLFERLAKKGIPFLLWEDVEASVEQFRSFGTKAAFNDALWGLETAIFNETILKESV
ncbi:conserved hypothetical protein [Rhodospirillaceae bacterium LM-1]|nr:conserved hypothetical protein [Rhodospirillaceae bacterium LM-1]